MMSSWLTGWALGDPCPGEDRPLPARAHCSAASRCHRAEPAPGCRRPQPLVRRPLARDAAQGRGLALLTVWGRSSLRRRQTSAAPRRGRASAPAGWPRAHSRPSTPRSAAPKARRAIGKNCTELTGCACPPRPPALGAARAAEGSAVGGRSPTAASATASLLATAVAAAVATSQSWGRAARAGIASSAAAPILLAATTPPTAAAVAEAARRAAAASAAAAEATVRGERRRKGRRQRLREGVAAAAIAAPAPAAVAASAHRGVSTLGRVMSGETVAGRDESQQRSGVAPSTPLPSVPGGLASPLPARRGDRGERGARSRARRTRSAAGCAARKAATRGDGGAGAGTKCRA